MKLSNYKLTAVILAIIIFASIIFIASERHGLSNTELYYPSLENMNKEEMINSDEHFQVLKCGKNVLYSISIEHILFNILRSDLFKLRHSEFMNAVLKFYCYSVFVVFFTNKKDGKKGGYVYS